VQVQHELAKRALKTCKRTGQNSKSRAGKLCGALEIHIAERFADLEMLLRRVVPTRLFADNAGDDVIVLVLANGNVVERNVRDTREGVVERGGQLPFLFLGGGKRRLDLGDLGLEPVSKLGVLLRQRDADFLRRRVATGLHFLHLLDDGTAPLVEFDEALRQRLGATLRKRCIQSMGVLTNPSDIKHRRSRSVT
jgi:hypothetical protein